MNSVLPLNHSLRIIQMTTSFPCVYIEPLFSYAEIYSGFIKGFCAAVPTEEIARQDYILTPGRYVGIEEQEDDGEPFEEKMGRLTAELGELGSGFFSGVLTTTDPPAPSVSANPGPSAPWGAPGTEYRPVPEM